ncbi:S8 family peptidase [Halovivax cerinus]|uniref:S8 family serine peptidase n=1 Tax=Halovivax cerinus TaxID=1487865 RepID=A0ABD5NTD7_9EURY|nr:S8 family serine peptidase [Halovivax cerinus]
MTNMNTVIGRRTVLQTLGAGLCASAVGAATPADRPGPGGTELLVGTSDGTSIASVRRTVESALPDGTTIVHENDVLGYVSVDVSADGPQSMASVVDRLERRSDIAYAEPNETLYALDASTGSAERPFDPDDPRFDEQTVPQQVDAPAAWDTTLGSMDVTIAVVDQGVDYTHPDLADRFSGDEGRDFVDGDDDPRPETDAESHGTHVAGIAAATTGNGAGIAGLSNCRVLSARALDSNGTGTLSDIADAIQWSADEGADLIALPLGGGGESETLRDAIDHAVDAGALPIAAAGGDGGDVAYPAAFDNCVAVSAVDADDEFASFSNYGPEIDVAAPGVDVLAPVPGREYERRSGTSMACGAAVGVAALHASVHPDESPSERRTRLRETAVDVGLEPEKGGAGRVAARLGDDGRCAGTSPFDSSTLYHPGDRVVHDGALWEADWFVWGQEPTERSRRWTKIGTC